MDLHGEQSIHLLYCCVRYVWGKGYWASYTAALRQQLFWKLYPFGVKSTTENIKDDLNL